MATRGKQPDVSNYPPEVWAYAAGFLDGEGHIGINKAMPRPGWRSRATTPRYDAAVVVVGTVKEPIAWLQDHFGGALRQRPAQKAGWKDQWVLAIGGKQAAEFCRGLLPYLKVKHRQATLLVEFEDTKTPTPKGHRRVTPADELVRREAYRNRMLEINNSYIRLRPQRLSEGAPRPGEAIVCADGKPSELAGTETS